MVKTGKSKAPPIACLLLCSGCRWRKICTCVNWSHLKFMHTDFEWTHNAAQQIHLCPSSLDFPRWHIKPPAAPSSSSLSAVTLFSENQSHLPPHLPSSCIFPTHSNFPAVSHVPICWASFFPYAYSHFTLTPFKKLVSCGLRVSGENVIGRKAEIGQVSFYSFKVSLGFQAEIAMWSIGPQIEKSDAFRGQWGKPVSRGKILNCITQLWHISSFTEV